MGQDCKLVEVDLEVGLMGAESIVAVEEEVRKTDTSSPPSPSRGWRIYVALLAIGLCAAAAIFFSVHDQSSMLSTLKQGESEGNEDLRHTLRSIQGHRTTPTKDAIHLEGIYREDSKVLTWTADADQAFKEGGLKLNKNNEIVIPKNGLYFVYSQVSFRVDCVVSSNDGPQGNMLEHVVYRASTTFEGRRELLHARRTTCERMVMEEEEKDDGRRWYTTVNVGAVFKLNRGDQLSTYTETLERARVDDESGQTFFGAFAL